MDEKDIRQTSVPEVNFNGDKDVALGEGAITQTEKTRWERIWPAMACGSGMRDLPSQLG